MSGLGEGTGLVQVLISAIAEERGLSFTPSTNFTSLCFMSCGGTKLVSEASLNDIEGWEDNN